MSGYQGLAPFPTKTTSDISMSRSTGPPPRRTRVRPSLDYPAVHKYLGLYRTLGGIFKLELFLPDDYPMAPPKIRFLTKIFHPNVDKLGRICLDVLKSGLYNKLECAGMCLPYLRQLVSRAPDSNNPALDPSAPRRPEPRRPARRRRCQKLEGG